MLHTLAGVFRWWVILLLAIVVAYSVFWARSEAILQAKFDEIRARGEPLTLAEAAARNPVGAQNAADVYQQAFAFIPQGTEYERALKEMGYARTVVAQAEPAITLFRQASAIPDCAFPVNWGISTPAALTFPHYHHLLNGARLLRIKARILAADGKVDRAVDDCAAGFRIAKHAKSDPVLTGLLVGYAIQGVTLDALKTSLSAGDPSPRMCRQLFDQLGSLNSRDLRRAFMGDRAMGISLFEDYRAGKGQARVQFGGVSVPRVHADKEFVYYTLYRSVGRPLLNLDEASYLDHMAKIIADVDGPPMTTQQIAPSQSPPNGVGILTALMLPGHNRASIYGAIRETEVAAARAALALKVYHHDHGIYPSSLAELERDGWGIPKDLFNSADLHYRREQQGFAIWSVGPDLKDDHGIELDRKTMTGDIVFRVNRSTTKTQRH